MAQSIIVDVPAGIPITPGRILKNRMGAIPGFVFDAINDLLLDLTITNHRVPRLRACLTQGMIITAIQQRSSSLTANEIAAKGWLNFEDAYREAGWTVAYDTDSDEVLFLFDTLL
jgi:hypothetical protein